MNNNSRRVAGKDVCDCYYILMVVPRALHTSAVQSVRAGGPLFTHLPTVSCENGRANKFKPYHSVLDAATRCIVRANEVAAAHC